MARTYRSKQFKKSKNRSSLTSRLYHLYKHKCKKRNIEFDLAYDRFIVMIFGNCYLCGSGPSNRLARKDIPGELIYNGIDRVDNNKGYSLGNVRTCCGKCNGMKSNHKLSDFKNHIAKIFKFSLPIKFGPTRPKAKRD